MGVFQFQNYRWASNKQFIGNVSTVGNIGVSSFIYLGPYKVIPNGKGSFKGTGRKQANDSDLSSVEIEGNFVNGVIHGDGKFISYDKIYSFIGHGYFFERGNFDKGELKDGIKFFGYDIDICISRQDFYNKVDDGTIYNWSNNNGFVFRDQHTPETYHYALVKYGSNSTTTYCEYLKPKV